MGSDVQETVQALEAVKADLLEHGWHQGDYYKSYADYTNAIPAEGTSACLLGACGRVEGMSVSVSVGFSVENSEIGQALQRTAGLPVAVFNDWPERTFNEVIDLIDRTILDVKAGVGEPDGA